MKPRSAKNKGRRLQVEICNMITKSLPGVTANDVRSRTMGENGADVVLSEAARRVFPFAVEARNREYVSIWASIEDAERHAAKEQLYPMVVVKRNRSIPYAVVRLEHLLHLLSILVGLGGLVNATIREDT